MPDLAVSHNHHPTGLLHVVTMNNEYIEDAWQTHARNLIDEINPSDSVKTFLLFRRLFKVKFQNTKKKNKSFFLFRKFDDDYLYSFMKPVIVFHGIIVFDK
jgi:hypothetical protein